MKTELEKQIAGDKALNKRISKNILKELILSPTQRQLGWTPLKTFMHLKDDLQWEFYIEMYIGQMRTYPPNN